MSTQYSLSDILPKDATGLPFQALVDTSTSQLDFALQAGVAASVINSKRYAYMGVGTHAQSGSAHAGAPGVMVLGYTGSPLAVSSNLQFLWLDRNGAANTTPADSYTIVTSGSIAASAATAHSLFGTVLSAIGSSVILNVEVKAETNDGFLLKNSTLTGGIWLSTSATQYEKLKPMSQATASALHFRNKVSNTTIHYTVWRKD